MFARIFSLLTRAEPDPRPAEDELRLAAAAVMVEAARMDEHFDALERDAIRRILAQRFDLSDSETETLLASAERADAETTQLFPFTRALVHGLTPEERVPIIEMLWEVVYADGVLTPEQDALIRRVAGLLYVSDRDRGDARLRVLRRLGHEP